MKYSIELDKLEYYPGDYLTGRIKIKPSQRTQIKDIEMTLSLIENWQYLPHSEIKNNIQPICKFLLNAYLFLDKPKDSIIDLDPKEYIFPFEEKLPDYLLPSFEYPQNVYSGSLRYGINGKFISPQKLLNFSTSYIIIKAIPKKDTNLNIKSSQRIKKWGVFSRGQTGLNVNCVTKNYKLTDQIPVEIEIDNTQSKMKVNSCKIKFCRKIIFKDKDNFLEKYSNEENLIKIKFNDFVNKKEKKKFNHIINLNTIQYKNFKPMNSPIKIQKNFKDYLPSLDGIILSCEYYIIVILKFDHYVPKEERPKAVIPIYIVHKLDNDHIEKAKKNSEVLKNNESNIIKKDSFIKGFEILDKDGKKQNQNLNNNVNSNDMKGEIIYNGFYKGIEYNNFNNQNEQFLNNEDNLKEDVPDLPSRETIIREYEKRNHCNGNNNLENNNNFNHMNNNNYNYNNFGNNNANNNNNYIYNNNNLNYNNNNFNNIYNNYNINNNDLGNNNNIYNNNYNNNINNNDLGNNNNINNNNYNNNNLGNNINNNNNNINDNININDIKFLNDFGVNNEQNNQNVNNNNNQNVNYNKKEEIMMQKNNYDNNIKENKSNISYNNYSINNNKVFAYPSLDDINLNDEVKNDNSIKPVNNNSNNNHNENNNQINNNFNYNQNINYNNQSNNNFNYNPNENNNQINNISNFNQNEKINKQDNNFNYNPNENYNIDNIPNRESNFNLFKFDDNNNEEEEKEKNERKNKIIDINAI